MMPKITKDVTVSPATGMIYSIWGDEKVGKSHLALDFPAPMVVFDIDDGVGPLLSKFKGKEITVYCYDTGDELFDAPTYEEIFSDIIDKFKAACNDPEIKTIVMDTNTRWWNIVGEWWLIQVDRAHKAKYGKGKTRLSLQVEEYARCNEVMDSFCKYAKRRGKNLVLISHSRPVYVVDPETKHGVETTDIQRDGWRRSAKVANIEVEIKRYTNKRSMFIKASRHEEYPTRDGLPVTYAVLAEHTQGEELDEVVEVAEEENS